MQSPWSGVALFPVILTLSGAPPDGPEDLVRSLYDEVTFEPEESPDWDRVRSMFLDEAIIVLRTSREETTRFDLDGFVGDFQEFIRNPKVRESGFEEKILRLRSTVFRELAHVLVLYEARIPGSSRPPQRGVDSFHLVREDGRWRIVSVLNDLPTPRCPVPRELQEVP